MAKQAVQETKERGEGLIAVTYVDTDAKGDYKRVPLNVASVHVVNNHVEGQAASFNVSELPDTVKNALIADAASKRIKTFVANHGAKDGSDAIELAKEVWQTLVSGNVYAKSEGGAKPGKKFSGEIYAKAWKLAYQAMAKRGLKTNKGDPIKELTDAQVLDLQTSLEAMQPKERAEKLRTYKAKFPLYEKALKKLQADEVDTKSNEVDEEAMPF